MKLNELRDNPGARKPKKRLGRGIGSGLGKTSGKGHKGAKARSGSSVQGFEGGQMPIYRRLPKRGFHNVFRRDYVEINLGRLQQAIDDKKVDAGKPIDGAALVEAGVLRRVRDGVRLLAKGELKAQISITVAGASKAAVEAVEKLGGTITQTAPKPEASPEAGPAEA
jgi:large subunit ribosomal protein L15